VASDKQRLLDAAARYGPSLDHVARRYVNPITGRPLSGTALVLKTLEGESRALSGDGRESVSSAGARGWAQFMPGTRRAAIEAFGVDPWRSPEEAVRALTLHQRGKLGHRAGLEGYNPGGGQGYVDYILGQKVGAPRRGGSGSATTNEAPAASASGFDAGGGLAARMVSVERPVVEASPLTRPEFSAGPVVPEGYQGVRGQAPVPPAELELPERTVQELPRAGAVEVTGDVPVVSGGGSGGSADLRPTGGYRGTEGPTRALFEAFGTGLQITDTKRHNTNPYSGKRSDHDHGNKDAFAIDASNGSKPTREMDAYAFGVARALGIKGYKRGTPINKSVTVDGIRYQLIYRGTGRAFGGNHMNHVHLGAKRVGR
jgi:hypothetical protein